MLKVWVLPVALAGVVLAGCVATVPAPVSDRAVPGKLPPAVVAAKPAAVTAPATAVVPPPRNDADVVVKPLAANEGPTYTVKQGDTMFSIAKTNGVPLRDLAAWNNIEAPFTISVGQVLRLSSPEGVAVLPPKPLAGADTRVAGTADVPGPADSNLKTQPLGQRVPYSDEAYALMAKGPAAAAVVAKVEPKTEVKPAAKPEVKPEPKADPASEPKVEAKAETKPVARAPGELAWLWPVEGRVIENFNGSSNKGIAIAGKRGQPVHASAAGRVILSGAGIRGLGKIIVIKHNNNFLSVYAHNDKLLVKEGQNVTQGQRIAEMGNSDADQVKLHFEIRRQGKPVDPIKLLPDT